MIDEKRLTPKQRREIRQKAKQLHQEEKNARLLNNPDFTLTPRTQKDVPGDDNTPRTEKDPDDITHCFMEWTQSEADVDGAWSWGHQRQWDQGDWDRIIYPGLCEFQRLTWSQICEQRTVGKRNTVKKKHYDMYVCDIHPEACKRWNEHLGLDQYETVFRFRLGNKPRLWGYKIRAKFFIIWWDKFHQIYPI
jgi:hypothetical protein